MATRCLFIPTDDPPYVREVQFDFPWTYGYSKVVLQDNIDKMHRYAEGQEIKPCLEVSGKSPDKLGASLSAFNLMVDTPTGVKINVEAAYQGSKVFEYGGPYRALYFQKAREAKKHKDIHNSGKVIGFNYFGEQFPNKPETAFYTYIYITALISEQPTENIRYGLCQKTMRRLNKYQGFTDVFFNPKESINCQARSVAVLLSLYRNSIINEDVEKNPALLDKVLRTLLFKEVNGEPDGN